MTGTAPAPKLGHFWESIENGFWFKDAYERLLDQLSTHRPSVWVEIGNYFGGSLAWLGVEVINRGLPVTLHAVDNFSQSPEAAFHANVEPIAKRLGRRFRVHVMDSEKAAPSFAPQSCDVIWIDADHSYEGVRIDINAWWDKLKPGGWMGGDDYMQEYHGVITAVEEFAGTHRLTPEIGEGRRDGHPWHWWLVQKP